MLCEQHSTARPRNRLAREKSPYLLQHADNPVGWYPWAEEAFAEARKTDRPVFLSIGYATCHWCHVMAHESFEDEEVAALLNRYFVPIKVDREERPDVDQIYMTACQALTGSGGWPLSVFLTPQAEPFFAGTYFPRTSRMGMPGFSDLLEQVAGLWQRDRARCVHAARQLTQALQPNAQAATTDGAPGKETLEKGADQLKRVFDPRWGGFGKAPKFPTPHNLTFLLRWSRAHNDDAALHAVEKTLGAMRQGGIFDQIGFGFHRYSVDEKWLVPHFEKMLYDQALLTVAYVEAYLCTGKDAYGKVADEILTYVLRDMVSPEGAFYCAEDADSEGEEGLFYLWTPEQVEEVVGQPLAELVCRYYGITPKGNFEKGTSIAHLTLTVDQFAAAEGMEPAKAARTLEGARQILRKEREHRVHPLKDTKILTSWNGLMIAALAKAYQALGNERYLEAAERAATFILGTMRDGKGRLLRRHRDGETAYPGYLDDYAFLTWGLIELYEAGFGIDRLEAALSLNGEMLRLFWDENHGGLFFTGEGNETLIARTKELYDGALPSGNSVAAMNLLRLARMTGDHRLEEKAAGVARTFSDQTASHPTAFTYFLGALDFMIGPCQEIVVAGDRGAPATRAMLAEIRKRYLPNKVLLFAPPGAEGKGLTALAPFLGDIQADARRTMVHVCTRHTCQRPAADPQALAAILDGEITGVRV